ncbi:type IX secretion system outer membrane channel protein PorV [Paradesertivirga mongoliensis]|uniref:Type IX secretion system outer membrane channel protein PorV n=1 Tax=Paradesertivirga mongoliensis TaxID=2100740 RepID=A0ABW4ZJS1_9SPHI|nr:type IX secretion system outer membrane channel protein PorV [Pedobacter mongoliensis]
MKRLTFKLTITLFAFSVSSTLYAQSDNKINVVTSAAPFLRIAPDARAGGMGEVGIATSPDASSAFWNLAKTSFNTRPIGASLTYTPWLKKLGLNDVYLTSATGYKKLDDKQAVAATFKYFSLGNIQLVNENGQDIGATNPQEFSIDVGYTRKLSEKVGLGVAMRYINSSLAKGDASNTGTSYKSGSAVAGDISFFYSGLTQSSEGWSFGATLTNLGTKINYTSDKTRDEYIPANLGLGTSYSKALDENSKLSFGLDLNKLLVPTPPVGDAQGNPPTAEQIADYRDKGIVGSWFSSFGDAPGGGKEELRELQISTGAEYWYKEQFALRAGYFFEDKTKGNRRYFTLGAGLKYNDFGLNFSYVVPTENSNNQNPLSNAIRFGILFNFDGKPKTSDK